MKFAVRKETLKHPSVPYTDPEEYFFFTSKLCNLFSLESVNQIHLPLTYRRGARDGCMCYCL